jgi:hypothetical protein
MPFDVTNPPIEPAHPPATRRQREDNAILFACPMCQRQRVNIWALAYEPDAFIVCPEGDLYGCSLCNDACIVARAVGGK